MWCFEFIKKWKASFLVLSGTLGFLVRVGAHEASCAVCLGNEFSASERSSVDLQRLIRPLIERTVSAGYSNREVFQMIRMISEQGIGSLHNGSWGSEAQVLRDIYLKFENLEFDEVGTMENLIRAELARSLESYYVQSSQHRELLHGARDIYMEMLRSLAKQDGRTLSINIKKYRILNQKDLVEIAKIAALGFGWGVSEFFPNYGIVEPDQVLEVAEIASKNDGWGLSSHIQNYGIVDQKILIKLAKNAAAECGWAVSQNIKNFGITSKKSLIEIAKIAALQDGGKTSWLIQNYGIRNPKALVEIAKIAAANSGWEISHYFKNYGIRNPKVAFEIASIAVEQEPKGVCTYIQNYGLKSQGHLAFLARKAASQMGAEINNYLNNFKISDPSLLRGIVQIAKKKEENRACP